MARPDSGELELFGQPYAPEAKGDAERAGVHIVQQELNLIPTLSVGENLFLNRLPRNFGFISRARLRRDAGDALEQVGLGHVHPDTLVSRLGIGQQQLVEIASALTRNLRLLILDEPTAMLTQPEVELLFARIRELKAAGVGLIYISHRMEELKATADRISVLRDGQVVVTRTASEISVEEMVTAMTGTPPAAGAAGRAGSHDFREEPAHLRQPVALQVTNLCRGPLTRDVSLSVHRGEVFGLSGLVGSGRTETLRTIFGADQAESGTVAAGTPLRVVRIKAPGDAVRAGIGMLPEDRKTLGMLLTQSISTNVTLANIGSVSNTMGWLSGRREQQIAWDYCTRLTVNCKAVSQRVGQLSGGNQQKVLIARWLLRDCDVLLCDEPTRGIDISARRSIYALLRELASSGKAIVVASSDQQELMELCDRIGVMSSGRLVTIFNRGEWSDEKLMAASFSGYAGRRVTASASNGGESLV